MTELRMKKLRMIKLWMFGIAALSAVSAMSENLISNGRFEAAQTTVPELWTISKDVVYNRSAGPGGQASLAFVTGKGASSVRQLGMVLVKGEKYKLSGYYQSKNFKVSSIKVVIHNTGWFEDAGIEKFPPNAAWTPFEKTFTAFDSKDKKYGVAIYAKNVQGKIQFADIKLEALTKKGINGSSSVLAAIKIDHLTPMQPRLNYIPKEKPELTFRCLAKLPKAYTEYAAVCSNPVQKNNLNKDGVVTLNLKGLSLGDHQLAVSVIERATGKKVLKSNYLITIIKTPKIDRANHKMLNSLVTEILNQPVREKLQFSNPRDGWVFISVPTKSTVKLDGKELYLPAGRPEAVALLNAGPHNLHIAGAKAGKVVVRSIPEIFNYPGLTNPRVTGNGSYGWDFMKKHVNYALTTLNGGVRNPDKKIIDEIKKLGFIWLANMVIRDCSLEKANATPGLSKPQYSGVSSDEFGFIDLDSLNRYSKMLRQVRNINNRLIYTYIVGNPSMWLQSDFMSTAINTSRGKGKLLYEAYCHPQANEKAAQAFLDNFLVDAMKKYNKFYPNADQNTAFILGNFNQIPVISLDYDPAVDFKYYLDMQLNTIVNHPEFKNLGAVGYWGSYYADEEIYRWSFRLMRHYAIEGKKNMLSTEYGFKYNPDLLKNGDFATGLTNWDKTGTITTGSLPDYGKTSQKRWRAPNNMGDTFAKFTRSNAQANKLSQTAVNLTKGKLYCLQFAVADYQDIKNKKVNPRLLGLNVKLPGVEIIKDKSFVYVDNHKDKRVKDFGRINLHRIVFRATTVKQPMIFSDKQAAQNQELILNYVKLAPYFE